MDITVTWGEDVPPEALNLPSPGQSGKLIDRLLIHCPVVWTDRDFLPVLGAYGILLCSLFRVPMGNACVYMYSCIWIINNV